MAGPFTVTGGWKRLFPVLGLLLLHGRATTEQKSVNSHFSSDYHLVFSIFGSAPEESTDSTSTYLVAWASVRCSSTGVCTV